MRPAAGKTMFSMFPAVLLILLLTAGCSRVKEGADPLFEERPSTTAESEITIPPDHPPVAPDPPAPEDTGEDPSTTGAVLTDADLTLGGITLGQSAAEIEALLGAADSIRDGDFFGTPVKIWRYADGLSVTMWPGQDVAAVISVGKPGPATARGLQVGDGVDRIQELYGPGRERAPKGRELVYAHPTAYAGLFIRFDDQGLVTDLTLSVVD